MARVPFGAKIPKRFLKRKDYAKVISEARTKAGAKRETPLIEKELGRELRNKPKKKKPASKRQKTTQEIDKMKRAMRNPKPRQGKSIGGDVMGAIRSRAEKAGFMTGKDDQRDIKEYLINERNKKMFDDAEKKEKKKKAKPKRKVSKSALAAARRAAGNIRLKKGGYASHNKKYGGGIYPKMGK
tara:strand:+ start:793 stop:1344 length:552 start_codon:yes stop_codon:yes gene_type:complete